MALSPARTRSIMITWRRAERASVVNNSLMRHPLLINRGSRHVVASRTARHALLRPIGRARRTEHYGRQNAIGQATRLKIQSDITVPTNCQRGPAWCFRCKALETISQEAEIGRGLRGFGHPRPSRAHVRTVNIQPWF